MKLEQAAREVIRQHSMECLSDKTVDALREALEQLNCQCGDKCFPVFSGDIEYCETCGKPTALAEQAEQECKNCTRSHPHEEMSKCCELRTKIARLCHSLRVKELGEQAEQEPVAWWCCVPGQDPVLLFDEPSDARYPPNYKEPLYAAPVRTKDLTDDEIAEIFSKYASDLYKGRSVIAADREKNK